jgi:sarcosine oxidase
VHHPPQAYFEKAEYVPLLLRAYELWERLEEETEQELMTLTGDAHGRANDRT